MNIQSIHSNKKRVSMGDIMLIIDTKNRHTYTKCSTWIHLVYETLNKYFGITMNGSREHFKVHVRRAIMVLSYKKYRPEASLNFIARVCSEAESKRHPFNHATVLHHNKLHESAMENNATDPEYVKVFNEIVTELRGKGLLSYSAL